MASHTKNSKFDNVHADFFLHREFRGLRKILENTCKFFDPDMNWRGCNKFKWIDEPEMVDWQRQVTNTLVEEKRHLSTEIKILTSRVFCLEHEKEQAISELKRIKKKLMNERKHGKEISSFVLGFLFGFFLVFIVLMKVM